MSQLFAWGGQSTGVSALASFLPKKSQGLSPSEWTGWISLQSKGLSRVFSNTTVQVHQFFGAQPSSQSNSHIHTWLGKTIALTRWTFVGKVMSLLLNMLSMLSKLLIQFYVDGWGCVLSLLFGLRPNYCSFSFSIIPSNEHPGLISFRMDWLDLLPVQGTLKSLLQHHSSKASILRCSAFFTVQLTSIHDQWKKQPWLDGLLLTK